MTAPTHKSGTDRIAEVARLRGWPETDIVVNVQGVGQQVTVAIHWAGGLQTSHALVRPVKGYEQLADYARLRARIEELRRLGRTMAEVAACVNQEGFQPPKRAQQFTSGMVACFLAKGGRSGPRPRVLSAKGLLRKAEWLLTDLARHLSMPSATLHRWRKVGWVHARKLPVAGGHWALWADKDELARLNRLRRFRRSWEVKSPPVTLTTPKPHDHK